MNCEIRLIITFSIIAPDCSQCVLLFEELDLSKANLLLLVFSLLKNCGMFALRGSEWQRGEEKTQINDAHHKGI